MRRNTVNYEQPKPARKEKGGLVTINIPIMGGDLGNYVHKQIQDYKEIGFTDWKKSDDGMEWIATAPIESVERHKQKAIDMHHQYVKGAKHMTANESENSVYSNTLDELAPLRPSDFLGDE